MSRDKQIYEMAKDIDKSHWRIEQDYRGCNLNSSEIAEHLYEAGYRKASEVARETVEAIKAEVSKKEQYVNDLFGYGGYVISTTDLEDLIRRYIFDTYEEAELKKKYTEGE